MNRLALCAVTGALALSLTACGEQNAPAKPAEEKTVVVQPAPQAQPAQPEQPAQPAQPAGENH